MARARAAFLKAYRVTRADATPLVLLVARDDPAPPYIRWLQDAGARVRTLTATPSERELALADGLVMTGAFRDLHAGLYGEVPRTARASSTSRSDRLDVATLNAALALDVPYVGVCRGHQLLNIASGGSLYQDVVMDGLTAESHANSSHALEIAREGSLRRLVGPSLEVDSEHHQAVRRLDATSG